MSALLALLFYSFIFLYGIVIGSFLNVCILRIPAKESLVPGSHCTNCGSRLRWRDLIPVFSYLCLRGRCRYCGAKISAQYPLVEAANGALYVAVFLANGANVKSVLYCLMASVLLVISVIDERTYEIPVSCNAALLVLGIAACALDAARDPALLKSHLLGLVGVSMALYLLYRISGGRAIGGGDVKMMAAAGLLIGIRDIVLAFFIGCILGSVIHLARMKLSGAERVLAMGPYLSAGILIAALFGGRIADWYFRMLGLR